MAPNKLAGLSSFLHKGANLTRVPRCLQMIASHSQGDVLFILIEKYFANYFFTVIERMLAFQIGSLKLSAYCQFAVKQIAKFFYFQACFAIISIFSKLNLKIEQSATSVRFSYDQAFVHSFASTEDIDSQILCFYYLHSQYMGRKPFASKRSCVVFLREIR